MQILHALDHVTKNMDHHFLSPPPIHIILFRSICMDPSGPYTVWTPKHVINYSRALEGSGTRVGGRVSFQGLRGQVSLPGLQGVQTHDATPLFAHVQGLAPSLNYLCPEYSSATTSSTGGNKTLCVSRLGVKLNLPDSLVRWVWDSLAQQQEGSRAPRELEKGIRIQRWWGSRVDQ